MLPALCLGAGRDAYSRALQGQGQGDALLPSGSECMAPTPAPFGLS